MTLPWEFFHIKIKLGMESELNQRRERRGRERREMGVEHKAYILSRRRLGRKRPPVF
jgi:hypothetical protein